jgi:hypothetical protein
VAVAADFFLIHVVQQEVLGVLEFIRHARIDGRQVIGERADVVVVVLGPAREVRARELSARPGNAERRLGRGAALDRLFQRGTELLGVHELGHSVFS